MVNFENIKPFCDALRAADGGVVAALHVLATRLRRRRVGAVENLEHIIRQLEGISEHISALMLDRHAKAVWPREEHKARRPNSARNDKPQTWQEVVEREVARLS